MRALLDPAALAVVVALAACGSGPETGTAAASGEVVIQGWPAGTTGEVRMWRNATVDNLLAGPFPIDGAGRFRYALGTPTGLMPFTSPPGVAVDPPDARWQYVMVMPTRLAGEESEATGELRVGSTFWKPPVEPGQAMALLWYVDRDVSVVGTDGDGCTFDQHFRAGWNFAIRRSLPGCTLTVTSSLPPDLGWHYEYLGP